MPIKKKKKPAKRAAKKTASQGAGLRKYRIAMKKATKVVDARIKKNEAMLKKLRAEKARKLKIARKRLAKSK